MLFSPYRISAMTASGIAPGRTPPRVPTSQLFGESEQLSPCFQCEVPGKIVRNFVLNHASGVALTAPDKYTNRAL